jgi:hypothetical protein
VNPLDRPAARLDHITSHRSVVAHQLNSIQSNTHFRGPFFNRCVTFTSHHITSHRSVVARTCAVQHQFNSIQSILQPQRYVHITSHHITSHHIAAWWRAPERLNTNSIQFNSLQSNTHSTGPFFNRNRSDQIRSDWMNRFTGRFNRITQGANKMNTSEFCADQKWLNLVQNVIANHWQRITDHYQAIVHTLQTMCRNMVQMRSNAFKWGGLGRFG